MHMQKTSNRRDFCLHSVSANTGFFVCEMHIFFYFQKKKEEQKQQQQQASSYILWVRDVLVGDVR
jgi:hypothetical protein